MTRDQRGRVVTHEAYGYRAVRLARLDVPRVRTRRSVRVRRTMRSVAVLAVRAITLTDDEVEAVQRHPAIAWAYLRASIP